MDPDPVPASEAQPVRHSRRRFLRWLGGLAAVSTVAMVATPIAGFLVPARAGKAGAGGKTLVATTADIPPGGGKVVALGSKPAILVNTDQGVRAYSAICTHLGASSRTTTWSGRSSAHATTAASTRSPGP